MTEAASQDFIQKSGSQPVGSRQSWNAELMAKPASMGAWCLLAGGCQ